MNKTEFMARGKAISAKFAEAESRGAPDAEIIDLLYESARLLCQALDAVINVDDELVVHCTGWTPERASAARAGWRARHARLVTQRDGYQDVEFD